MSSVVVVLDVGGVSAERFVAAWGPDDGAVGSVAVVSDGVRRELGFWDQAEGVVVLSLGVNVVSSAVYDVIRRVVGRVRSGGAESSAGVEEIEIAGSRGADGSELVVVRARKWQ